MGKTTGRFGLRAGEPHRHLAAALPDSPLTAPNEGSDVARDKLGTRTATVPLAPGVRNVIGIGRVKMPTLAIPCRRELQIPDFVPVAYFEVVATARMRGETFWICHAPKEGIVERAKPPGPTRARAETYYAHPHPGSRKSAQRGRLARPNRPRARHTLVSLSSVGGSAAIAR